MQRKKKCWEQGKDNSKAKSLQRDRGKKKLNEI